MNIKEEYKSLETNKTQHITRAELISSLTIPKIFPTKNTTEGQELTRQYQSVGSIGTETLVSKINSTLFNEFFFDLQFDELEMFSINEGLEELRSMIANSPNITDEERQQIMQQIEAEKKTKGDIGKTLSRIKRSITQKVLTEGMINRLGYALYHLFITGNICVYVTKDYKLRLYNLREFVVRRDREGRLIKVIANEKIIKDSLEPEIREQITNEEDEIDLLTQAKYNYDLEKWEITECVEDIIVNEFKLNNCPFIVPFTDYEINNEYNYPYLNNAVGDLYALNGLEKNMLESSASASRTIFLVRPNSTTNVRDLQDAENLDFITGNMEDISILRGADVQTLSITQQHIQLLRTQLQRFFLMNISAQRSGERVTAEEIQRMIADIDSALGNIYSILAEEVQLPLVKIVMEYMQINKEIDKKKVDDLNIKIITGSESVRKQTAFSKLQSFISLVYNLQLNKYLNPEEIISRMAYSLNIEDDGLVKSETQVQLEMQREQQQQMQMQQMQEQAKQQSQQQINEGE